MDSRISECQDLIIAVCREDCTGSPLSHSVDQLAKLLNELRTSETFLHALKGIQHKLKEWAVALWNSAVVRCLGNALEPVVNAQYLTRHGLMSCLLEHVEVRQTSCDILSLYHGFNNASTEIDALNKHTTMALKTARAWLDAGRPENASNPLSIATEGINKQRQSEAMEEKRGKSIEADLFKLLCYKAEVEMAQQHIDTSMSLIEESKALIMELPNELTYFCMLCYNFGVDCFQHGHHEVATKLLQYSFELGKNSKGEVTGEIQARTLRLLANAFVEMDSEQNWQKALNAVGLANMEHCHPAGLFLKIKILLHANSDDVRLKAGTEELICQRDLSPNVGLKTVKLLMEHGRESLAFEMMTSLRDKFRNTPDSSKLSLSHVDLLLQSGQNTNAQQLVEDIITEHKTGEQLPLQQQTSLHSRLWDCASRSFENKDFAESLQWYNYSWSILSSIDQMEANTAKLHRNRTACHLAMNQIQQAEDSVKQAERCDPSSPYTFFFHFKTALAKKDNAAALESLKKLDASASSSEISAEESIRNPLQLSTVNTVQSLICLAAQLALEQSNRDLAVASLEQLVHQSPNTPQVLTALRCLCRLNLTADNPDASPDNLGVLTGYVELAYRHLNDLSTDSNLTSQLQDEAAWFMKIAWNLALKGVDAFNEMHRCFNLCYQLSIFLPQDHACCVRQKTCLLMAAAASLQVAKCATKDRSFKNSILEQTLEHVRKCGEVLDMIQSLKMIDQETDSQRSTTVMLLLLYEFEARVLLNDGAAEKVLEKAIALPQCEAKAFETIAALAMDGNSDHRALGLRALKVAIKKHLQQVQPDYVRCSKAFHSLVELTMQGRSQPSQTCYREAWDYCMDAYDVINNKAMGKYPEDEILWLMTRIWNSGIQLYSGNNTTGAVRWLELSMKMLEHMPTMKTNYTKHMSRVYGDVLEKIDKSQQDGAHSMSSK